MAWPDVEGVHKGSDYVKEKRMSYLLPQVTSTYVIMHVFKNWGSKVMPFYACLQIFHGLGSATFAKFHVFHHKIR